MDNLNINQISNLPYDSYNFINNLALNPIILIVLVLVILIYFILFSSLGNNININTGESNNNKIIESILWGLLILLILLNGASYFLNLDIIASIKNFFSKVPELNIEINDLDGDSNNALSLRKEVFHIPENIYNYQEAKALCKAFDSELANYEEIEEAYERGGDWCSYGWSADQLALYPTNLKKWNKLQKIKGREHSCGRPGINGGYIANPNVRFGVNCYGNKPIITGEEVNLMNNSSIAPKTKKDIKLQKLVDEYKDKLTNIILAPFNRNRWNEPLF